MIKAIFLDADGTLINLRCRWQMLKQDILERFTEKGLISEEERKKLEELRMILFVFALEQKGLKKELDKIWRKWELEEVKKVGFEVFSFTPQLLEEIKKKGKKIVIVSANCHDTLTYVFESAGLLQYVDVICGRDDVVRTKPHPAHFECALKKLGLRKNEAIMVGDNMISDVIGASVAGLQVIHIEKGEDFTNKILSFL